ncbi:hypothetical protein [Paenibacillus xylaniclasticus]|uniref:hypothetical protein n=1 Tax=Paenibacillus xylaniclasticus TaxID=588083 RepID=UPI0017766140|nr:MULTISPECIES: hypothetical protein [Paenibacillus]GFN31707.1 hypothetical protein PCURB6_19670 [Paenibacillus curdlanolyticus]
MQTIRASTRIHYPIGLGSAESSLLKLISASRILMRALLSLACYAAGAILNIYLLRLLPYTLVVPANALTFV